MMDHHCTQILELTIPCHGDGLTIDRIMRAKRNRRNHPEPLNRFDGMEASPQEWHKTCILLQASVIIHIDL